MFEDLIKESSDPVVYESYNPVAEMIHQNLRPKIALIGFPGVGKTTITKLIKAEEIPTEHIPTVTGDIVTIKIGRLHFHLWDFAGQEEYSFLWPSFLQNSDGVLVVTDSSLQNIEQSKFFLDLAKKEVPNARMRVIANKQDSSDAMDPRKIGRLLSARVYGMVAIDPKNRGKMIKIIGELLNLSPQLSPMIRPLLDRDKALEEAEILLEKNDFEGAIEKFKNIAELSRELGDDKVSLELLERIKMIESLLNIEKTESAPKLQPALEKKSALEIPEISTSSKPIHDEIPPTLEKKKPTKLHEEKKDYFQITPSISETMSANSYQNFVSHNIHSILSTYYIEIDFKKYNKIEITDHPSKLTERSLIKFLSNCKSQLSNIKMNILPKIPKSNQQPLNHSPNTTVEKPYPAERSNESLPNHNIDNILTDENIPIQEKIKAVKEQISILENRIEEAETNLGSNEVSQDKFKSQINNLRKKRKILQEKLSDLNIQMLNELV